MGRRIYSNSVFDWGTLALISATLVHENYEGPVSECAAPADYLDVADLKSVLAGGLIREDVANDIFDISDIPTPFLDMIASDGFKNPYSEWSEDKLPTPSTTNKVVSGSDRVSTDNDANRTNAIRVGNHAQVSTKEVFLTERQSAMTDIVGTNDEMGYQTARRLQDLRRDCEAASLSNNGSIQDDNNATAGQTAGAGAWLKTNVSVGATGAVGGFNTGTKLVVARTLGTGRALSFAFIQTQIENVYNLGGNTTVLMSVPGLTKRLGQFLLTTTNSAKPTQNVDGEGKGVAQISQQFMDAFKTDFGFFMQIVPNRLQPFTTGITCDVFGFDPRYWKFATLYGWKVSVLAKLGLSERKMLHVDWMTKCFLERANFNVADILSTSAVTA